MASGDNIVHVSEFHAVDYAHLPGEEQNPLMESTLHVKWGLVLLNSALNTRAGTDDLVTGNVAFAPGDGGPHTAPDIMVIPGAAGSEFGRYEPGPNDPLPSVCVEIVSPSNTKTSMTDRCRRLLRLGVAEVYVLDPWRDTIVRVELDGDQVREVPAIGHYSERLGLTFSKTDGRLAVCCPGGRLVRPGDEPFGWLAAETERADRAEARADQAEARADRAEARADQAEARIGAIEARLEALREEIDQLRER